MADPRYREKAPESCTVRAFFDETARPGGVAVVVLEPTWSNPDLPDRPDAGWLVLFDQRGRIVPVFEAANYISASGRVVEYLADGAVAVVYSHGYAGEPNWTVDSLHVVPATADQRPILSVLIGAPDTRFPLPRPRGWSWQADERDGSGNLIFTVGPVLPDGSISPRASFHYSAEAGRYVGPSGSLSGDFYLFEADGGGCAWAVVEQFVTSHGVASTPSKDCCSCNSTE